jgi:hypothetical protein
MIYLRIFFIFMAFAILWACAYVLHIKGNDWWGEFPTIFTTVYGMAGSVAMAILLKDK